MSLHASGDARTLATLWPLLAACAVELWFGSVFDGNDAIIASGTASSIPDWRDVNLAGRLTRFIVSFNLRTNLALVEGVDEGYCKRRHNTQNKETVPHS